MASSNNNERKIKVTTQTKILGKTEVEWEIVGWGSSTAHQVRSNCLVNIGTGEIRLHFHLYPYLCHEEPDQKFCQMRNEYMSQSTDCGCSTCKNVPLTATSAEVPLECPTRSAGYSLLVDVLKNEAPNAVTLGVTVEKLNGDSLALNQHLVRLESDSPQKELTVVDNFWRMLKWTEDKSGNISNCVKTRADTVEDARFLLTVMAMAYQIEVCKTDAPIMKPITDATTVRFAEEESHAKPQDHQDPKTNEGTETVVSALDQPEVPVSKPVKSMIWTGLLQWQNGPPEEASRHEREMKCPATTYVSDDSLPQHMTVDDFPEKLIIGKFIPTEVLFLATAGLKQYYLEIMDFTCQDGPAQDSLIRILDTGNVGIVHLSGLELNEEPSFSPTLILRYCPTKKVMWGSVPVDQPEFASRLEEGIQIYQQMESNLSKRIAIQRPLKLPTGLNHRNARGITDLRDNITDLMLKLEMLREKRDKKTRFESWDTFTLSEYDFEFLPPPEEQEQREQEEVDWKTRVDNWKCTESSAKNKALQNRKTKRRTRGTNCVWVRPKARHRLQLLPAGSVPDILPERLEHPSMTCTSYESD